MARRLWLSLVMLAAGAGLLVAAAAGVSNGNSANTRRGGTLRLARHSDIEVDPALAWTGVAWMFEFATCAKLFNFPDEAGTAGTRVMPDVSKGFPAVSRDGRTYTFELERSFRFHNGVPVTARSFALAFDRFANPRMKVDAGALTYIREIVGANAFIDGKARTISGIRVLGRYRLQIRLRRPLGDFLARLTMPFFCPILPSTPIDPDGIDYPPGSGPYFIAERIPNRRIVLRRNRFYRGTRPANVDQIVFTIGGSADACWRETEQNRVDYCPGTALLVPEATMRRIADQYGINRRGGRFLVGTGLATSYFAFNHDRPAFKGRGQIPLKKAINYALDRPELARAAGYLGARRTDQMLPPPLGRNTSIYPLTGAAPRAARRWLARAKYKPTKLVLYTWQDSFGIRYAEVFKFNLEQIGIDVDVKYFDRDELTRRAGKRGEPYDVAVYLWAADYADGASFFEPLLNARELGEPGHLNFSYFDDARTNARMRAAGRLTDAARRRAWADLDADLMRNNPPWAPFAHATGRTFISASFGCYVNHPLYGVDLAAACKK